MKAADAYRLIVTRGGFGPSWMAAPERTDRIEVVELRGGEVVLFWDLPAREARRLVRALRKDLPLLEADDFLRAWREA